MAIIETSHDKTGNVTKVTTTYEGRACKPPADLQFVHWDCSCGSIECLANPRPS